jgi:Tfp pilus assembly protein PilO
MSRLDDSTETRWSRYGSCLHAGGLAVAAALFAVVYVPAIGALRFEQTRITDEIATARRLVDSGEKLRQEHRELTRQQADAQSRAEQLLARIPDAPRETEFLAHLARLARTAPLSIRDFRPVATQAHDRFSEVQVELSAQGSYQGICRFLAGLETLPRLCDVTRLNINSERSADGTYPLELTLAIYFTPRAAEGHAGGRHE